MAFWRARRGAARHHLRCSAAAPAGPAVAAAALRAALWWRAHRDAGGHRHRSARPWLQHSGRRRRRLARPQPGRHHFMGGRPRDIVRSVVGGAARGRGKSPSGDACRGRAGASRRREPICRGGRQSVGSGSGSGRGRGRGSGRCGAVAQLVGGLAGGRGGPVATACGALSRGVLGGRHRPSGWPGAAGGLPVAGGQLAGHPQRRRFCGPPARGAPAAGGAWPQRHRRGPGAGVGGGLRGVCRQRRWWR